MIKLIELTPDYHESVKRLVNLDDVSMITSNGKGCSVGYKDGRSDAYKESYDNVKRNLAGMVIEVIPK
jgi:hypothetical protein